MNIPHYDSSDQPGLPVQRDLGEVPARMQAALNAALPQVYWRQRTMLTANARAQIQQHHIRIDDHLVAHAIEAQIAAQFIALWCEYELGLTRTAAQQLIAVLGASQRPVPVMVDGRLHGALRHPWPAAGWVLVHALALLALSHRHALVPLVEDTPSGPVVSHRIGGLTMPGMTLAEMAQARGVRP